MRKLSQYPLYISIGFAAVGFLLLFLAWNAAAELDHVSGQIPILISGGLTGLGLIAVGLTMAVTAEMRRTTAQLRRELQDMSEVIASATPVATGPTPLPSGDEFVVAGATSYHDPDCRLVTNRGDLQRMDAEVAEERGLTACRICKPAVQAS
jgi:hypothetical protein